MHRSRIVADERALPLLQTGTIELVGQLLGSSNETFLVQIDDGVGQALAIYKPELGERPLRDFEPGLYRRERAAYLLSVALEWEMVPTTVIRDDGPLGCGSLQRFVEHDRTQHYFTLVGTGDAIDEALRRMALFDVITNNTDRKSGHVLLGVDGHIWGIDHGLCFAAPFKLRTVIWDFSGEQIDDGLLEDIAPLAEAVPEEVAELLHPVEVRALRQRVATLLAIGEYPMDTSGMRFPWPLV